ncbi:hypothetical protein TNCV_3421801 [Trichonephila clavipes]|nr:hypothetical protein TNCV_3421801 [Trichonephila clavipes]
MVLCRVMKPRPISTAPEENSSTVKANFVVNEDNHRCQHSSLVVKDFFRSDENKQFTFKFLKISNILEALQIGSEGFQ